MSERAQLPFLLPYINRLVMNDDTFFEVKSLMNSSTSKWSNSAISTSTDKEVTFLDFKYEYSNSFDKKR